MFDDLTFQQFCALDYNRNMVVTAGPGAGKTKILSNRFCFILLTDESVSISKILTLTFTEKAAEEMKGRIYELLGQLENTLKGNDFFRNRIRDARIQFHKNRISTIHSFCADLLREHPVESGVDPEFSIIKGSQQKKLIERSIEKGIAIVWDEDRERLSSLLQVFNGYGRLKSSVNNLIEHPFTLKRVGETINRIFSHKDWEEQVLNEYCVQIKEDFILPYLSRLREAESSGEHYDALMSILEEWHETLADKEYSGLPVLFGKLRDLVGERKSNSSRFSIRRGLREISYVDLVADYFPDLFMKDFADRIFREQLDLFIKISEVCFNQYQLEKARINSLDFADLEAKSHEFLSRMSVSNDNIELDRIRKKYRYIMVDEFQDTNRVQWEIIRFLCERQCKSKSHSLLPGKLFVVGDKKQSIYKFRGGDVTVFESVTSEIKKSNPDPPEEMFWRNNVIKVLMREMVNGYDKMFQHYINEFENLPDAEKKDLLMGDIFLPHNFRSRPYPVNFVNNTFDMVFGNKGAHDIREYETTNRRIIPAEKDNSIESKGSATIYLTNSSAKGKDKAEQEAVIVTKLIESILGRHGKDCYEYITYGDIRKKINANNIAIGILFFSFNNLKIFETILREADLSFNVHRGKGLFRCPEVMDVIQLLKYISDEREKISLLSALRSPIFGFKDPEVFDLFYNKDVSTELMLESGKMEVRRVGEQIRSWRCLSSSLTLAELIRKVVSDRCLVAVNSVHPNGKQRLANLEKFIETARRFQMEDQGTLKDFIEYCLRMAEEEDEEGEALVVTGDESPISLMTIHAAKGLEFPMVIIPDLNRRIPSLPDTGKPLRVYQADSKSVDRWNSIEGEIPIWPVGISGLNFEKNYSPLGRLLVRRNRLEEIAENRRVFYVGCTRTKDHLVLIGQMNKGLKKRVEAQLSTEDYREHATIMDLLNDIYLFDETASTNAEELPGKKVALPTVIWTEPETRSYKALNRGGKDVSKDEMGKYDDKIREKDLSAPVKVPEYFQLSFSTVSMFRKCPLRFFYNIVLGLKWDGINNSEEITAYPKSEEYEGRNDNIDSEILPGDALFIGGIVHSYFEKESTPCTFDNDLFEHLLIKYNNYDDEKTDRNKAALFRKNASRHIRNALKDKKLKELMAGHETYSEVPFLVQLDHGCEFRGVIDRLLLNREKGNCIILDWKTNDLTGKNPIEVAAENDYFLQITFYKWAAEQILKKNVEHQYIYFTDTGYLLENKSEEQPIDIINDILRNINSFGVNRELWIQEGNDLIGRGNKCLNCEYRESLCEIKRSD